MSTLPAILQTYVPPAEQTPRALAELFKFTSLADVARENFILPALQQAELTIKENTTLHLQSLSANGMRKIHVHSGVTLNLLDEVTAAGSCLMAKNYLHVAAGAVVNHVRLTLCSAQQMAFVRTEVQVAAGAAYHCFSLTHGAKKLRQDLLVQLQGAAAQFTLAHGALLQDMAHQDLTVRLQHNAPNCTSDQLIKAVVRDAARSVFQGQIQVAAAAQQTNANQLHQALLLGERAMVDAKPELEIFADEVKCTHGNTVGALDAAAQFYLQARGIPAAAARDLLLQAFIAEITERAPEFAAAQVKQYV